MRSYWWVVAVLAALWACVAATALRNTQVENEFRIRRRFSSEAPDESDSVTNSPDIPVYSTRPRSARRRESATQNDTIRTRTRSRLTNRDPVHNKENDTPRSSPQTERNERVSNYRNAYIRTRKKPLETSTEAEDKISSMESSTIGEPSTIRSRTKQRTSFRSTIDDTAPTSERTKVTQFKSLQTNRDSSTRTLPTTHFRPRSRTTIPNEKAESTTQRILRGRVNTRVTLTKSLPDHDASGSTITENIMVKDAITSRSTLESRNSRKLRYKTRLTDIDANLTDEGISLNNEVTNSSQNNEHSTSQEEIKSTTKTEELRSSTEASNPSIQGIIVKRPLTRGKINYKPSSNLPKTKSEISEISEDDNYPESFKALLQAKAGAFYKQEVENKTNEISTDDNKPTTTSTSAPIINKQFRKPDLKNRTSYLSKYRKSSTFTPTSTFTTKVPETSSERARYRFNRKFKASDVESSKSISEVEETTPRKAFVRPSYYSRLRSTKLGSTSTEETDSSLNSRSASTESTVLTKTDSPRSITNKTPNIYIVTPVATEKPNFVNKQSTTLGETYFHSRNFNKSDIQALDEKETAIENETNKNNVQVIPLKENDTVQINNEVNNTEESENVEVYHVTTPKYHSSYRDETHTTYVVENILTTIAPPIRNLYTRKFAGRKQKESESTMNDDTPAHTKVMDIGKYTDMYSKSTTAMMNGITSEPERYKGRYSSKYRGSVDRPMYRPTVPSVTPSTISTSTLNINDSSSVGFTTVTNKSPAETSTASHVLSLRTSTMLPSVDEILFNSISSAAKEDMAISTSTSSTREPPILTLDIDPETKQIRTEKPDNGMGSAVFKFIPIDEVTVAPQGTNVLRLATKSPIPVITTTETMEIQPTEFNTQTPQIPLGSDLGPEATTTTQTSVGTTPSLEDRTGIQTQQMLTTQTFTNPTTSFVTEEASTSTTSLPTTTIDIQNNINAVNPLQNLLVPRGRSLSTSASNAAVKDVTTTKSRGAFKASETEIKQLQEDAKFLQALLLAAGQNPATFNLPDTQSTDVPIIKSTSPQSIESDLKQFEEDAKLLKALLEATGQNPANFQIPKLNTNPQTTTSTTTTSSTNIPKTKSTSSQSIESDLKQFEEDAKLLKALLAATGQNPADFKIPKLNINPQTTTTPTTTSSTTQTTTSTTTDQPTTSSSLEDDIRRFQEDAKLLQALLQATGQSASNLNLPVISGVTSNVRIASNPLTTSIVSNAPTTTPTPTVRPIFTRTQTTIPLTTTSLPILSVTNPLQSRSQTMTTLPDDIGISTTVLPYINRRRQPTTTAIPTTTRRILRRPTTLTPRQQPIESSTITTEMPNSSTFSVEEDLAFLKNLKSVLNTNNEDPEKALANRIIALAVERSLNDIESNNQPSNTRAGKAISGSSGIRNTISPTTRAAPTTTTSFTTRRPTTTPTPSTPSIEDDIRQFEQDSKLLQALLKATGQDPSKFNIPTITSAKTNVRPSPATVSSNANDELKLLSTLLASPSPLNEQFDTLTQKTVRPTPSRNIPTTTASIKILQDDPKFLQSLVQLRSAQETTTLKTKLVNSGLTSDEALTKLLNQQKLMDSEATKSPVTVSTEYGKSNDALLAALLKEQGFGPTTASSLDEQLRLAALLNQVVVTPKTVRTTTPAPAPAPRRPILDGLSWLWQQWRETAPGPPRQNRRPAPTVSSSATSNRVNWFGSGPFVGNAPEKTDSNRIPLEPPRAVAAEQTPGRGQIVSAAINVTRAFSQFLGAAIQGAAQTVQNVIKAGQKAASDVYVNGSG